MIKAVATNESGKPKLLILGLSRRNTELLLAGKPIPVKLGDLGPDMPDLEVLMLGGETEQDIVEDMRVLGLGPMEKIE